MAHVIEFVSLWALAMIDFSIICYKLDIFPLE
jgi:hypothetical protein